MFGAHTLPERSRYMFMQSDFVHPLASVTITQYSTSEEAITIGLGQCEQLSPSAGLHK